MKILVTVGTTEYDSLISYIDSAPYFCDFSVEFQIANGKYLPQNHSFFTFISIEDIMKKYREADLIITHAGASTINKLLEMKKKFIVVPNLERSDRHQIDIADFISKNKYALVAYSLSQLEIFTDIIQNINFKTFNKETFFKSEEIVDYILGTDNPNGVLSE